MSNRAERRRRGHRQPVVIAGDGIVAADPEGSRYEARPHAELPAKQPGVHRWIASGAWVLTPRMVETANDPDKMKFLDHENLMHLAIGCWDCEQQLGTIKPGSRCPAGAT